MANARHERLAHALASGLYTKLHAWAVSFRPDLKNDLARIAWQKSLTDSQANSYRRLANRQDIKARMNSIMVEVSDRRMAKEQDKFTVPRAAIIKGLYENYQRAAALIPVIEKGEHIGLYKPDYKAANQALELLGTEAGMFVKQHHHLHANADPMEGGRNEVLRSIRVLTDNFSDADLRELGLQRLDVFEAGVRRTNGTGDESGQTLPAVS